MRAFPSAVEVFRSDIRFGGAAISRERVGFAGDDWVGP